MPQTIDVPDIGLVEFPDGLSDADIVASIKKSRVGLAPGNLAAGAPRFQSKGDYVSPTDLLAKAGSVVTAPIEQAGAKLFGGLQTATSGDVPPVGDYKPDTIEAGKPMLNLPSVSDDDIKLLPPWLQSVAGVVNSITKGLSGMTTPGNALMAPVAGVKGLTKPIAAGFLTAMVAGEPKAIQDAWKTFHDPNATRAQKTEAIASAAVVNPTFAALLTKGLVEAPAAPSLTPLTDEAVKQTVTEKGAKNAIQQKTDEVISDVRTQPGSGEGKVPVEGGVAEAGARSAPAGETKEQSLAKNIQSIRPAIKMMDGDFVVGQKFDVHEDIIGRHRLDAKDMDSRTFVDENGNEVSREELEQMGVKSDKPVEGAHASDLAKVQMEQEGYGTMFNPHDKGVEAGLKLTEKDVPGIKEQQSEASKNKMSAIENQLAAEKAKDPDAAKRWGTIQQHWQGLETYLGGMIEGANREGPNYRLYVERQKAAQPAAPEMAPSSKSRLLRKVKSTLKTPFDEGVQAAQTGGKQENPYVEGTAESDAWNKGYGKSGEGTPEMVGPGMGSANLGEVAGEGNPDVYGVAERVREQRAAAGQVGAVPPGGGVSAPDSVERGRDLLDKGADPEKTMKDFEATKKLSSDDMAVARAHGERLARKARAIEELFGTDSDEFRSAQKNLTDWDTRSKAMQTEWHKTGMAQQGETDIDTGSFSGLQRAFTETTGKEFNQPQKSRAKQLAGRVKSGEQASIEAMKKLNDELHRATEAAKATAPRIHPKILEIANKIVEGLDKRADAARARIRERSTRLAAGVDPTVILDLAEIGASHIAHLTMDFAEWSAKMTEELGDWVKPHLQEVFDKSQKIISGLNTNEAVKKAIRSPKERAPKTVEAKALADAQKEVRNAAVKAADAEKKARVAKAGPERQQAREKADAEKRTLQAAQKTVREAAARAAKAATTERVKEAAETPEAIQDRAAQDALKAANDVAARAAKDAADAEQKQRDAKSKQEKSTADIQRKAAQKAVDAANKRVKDAASKAAEAERKNQAEPERKVWDRVKDYIDKGEISFDDIRHKVATDLGMTVKKVTELLTRNKRAKYLAEDAWRKQQNLRRFKQVAKRWVTEQSIPGFQRAIQRIPRYLFALKVGFHGTVALGTHAPMVLFQPKFWSEYFTNYGKMYRMVKSPSYYEMQVQDLLRRPNYITARRAGLVNDPYTFEDFNSPDIAQYVGRLSGMGNRGYAVLKLLRQDIFDQQWNDLPKTQQIPEVAQALADGINHATGVVKVNAPKGANVSLFAPRLLASRAAWLVGDPARAAKAFADWKNAPPGEKQFAINQVKEKAWVVGTAMTMLAINQGILSAVGSKQKVNMTDPTRSDFMKFKVAGMNFSYGNAMLSMARLPLRLYSNVKNEGKLNKVIYEDENVAKTLFDFGRSQASPAASLALDLGLGRDFEERPLPRKAFGLMPGDTNVPKRLKAQGVEPYTWAEFVTEAALPIPGEEAAREVWREHFKMDPHYVKAAFKALATVSVMGATGGRLTEDTEPQQ